MMKCYIEITLLPCVEVPINFLWEKVYQQVHLALVEKQDARGKVNIGVSFPEYDGKKHSLGRKLRLLALSKEDLENINIDNWLSRLIDYVQIAGIQDVPKTTNVYAIFKRIQTKSSNARLARRKAKREGISYDQALSLLNHRKEQISKVPYLHMKSLSTGRRFRLMIDCVETIKTNDVEGFSTYGLSSDSSVPVF